MYKVEHWWKQKFTKATMELMACENLQASHQLNAPCKQLWLSTIDCVHFQKPKHGYQVPQWEVMVASNVSNLGDWGGEGKWWSHNDCWQWRDEYCGKAAKLELDFFLNYVNLFNYKPLNTFNIV